MKNRIKIISVIGLLLLSGVGLVGCSTQKQADTQGTSNTSNKSNVTYTSSTDRQLANAKYQSGKSAVMVVNHNHAQLSKKWTQDSVHYANLDKFMRTSDANTGWLDKQNVANDSLRTRQTYKPTGWHQSFNNGQPIINRGHEIAYSLSKGIGQKGQYNPKAMSGDQNNPKNLFTQTAFSNQELQTIYESKVRNALNQGKKVVYQVQPIFKGKDAMANGVHMQAISTDGSLNFNVYLFNVQPGIKFNYADGDSSKDSAMKVPTPKGAPHFNDNNNRYNKHNNYGRNNSFIHRHRRFIRHYAEYRVGRHIVRHAMYHHRISHMHFHRVR